MRRAGRLLNLAGLATGLVALVLQFAITIPASMEAGRSLAGSLVFYFSFFTILTNIGAVLVHCAALSGRPAAFETSTMRAGMAVAIAVVAIVYVTVLARLWQPQGLSLICDVLLHYVTPAIYLVWWLAAGADGTLRWRAVPLFLAYPLAYLAYIMARLPFAGEVPYPFLDIGTRGIRGVALSSLAMLALFLVLSVLVVLADRGLSRFRRPEPNRIGPAG
jgi:hypothetical protein